MYGMENLTIQEQPLAYGAHRLVVTQDHVVAEDSADMQAHNIISFKRSDPCYLIDGTVEIGLPYPYQDYVTVQRLTDHKIGKISRYCVTKSTF